jgi:hypothetical protein
MMQLDLFAAPAPPPPIHIEPLGDHVVEALVEHGYAHNHYLLRLNASIGAVATELPSRLFQFPIEFVDRDRQEDGESKLWLRHPDFAGLPVIDAIERDVGVRPVWSPVDEFGRARNIGTFWHAIDLLTDEHFRGMLDTRNFTDKPSVINGLRYHMDYGGLSTVNARIVLAEYGSVEPDDRSDAFLRSDAVRITNSQQGKFVGMWTKDEQSVWAAIHGLEDKLFRRRNGFLAFSPAFLAEKETAA